MGKYFVMYHEMISPYISKISNENFYSTLFSWAYEGEITLINKGQVGKWIKGTTELPNKILNQVINDIDGATVQYEIMLDKIINDSINDEGLISEDSKSMLEKTMEKMLSVFPLLPEFKNEASFCKPSTKAFVSALIYDAIERNKIWLDPSIEGEIENKLEECKDNNIAFRTIYIIDILLNEPNKLLKRMLEKTKTGLSNEWKEKINEYKSKKNHGIYTEISLDKQELLLCAKVLTHSDRRGNPGRSLIVGEFDICRAIVRCKNSTTITKLKADLQENATLKAWDALAEECQKEMYSTTISF